MYCVYTNYLIGHREMEWWFKSAISKHILKMNFIIMSCEIALRLIPLNNFDDELILAHVISAEQFIFFAFIITPLLVSV